MTKLLLGLAVVLVLCFGLVASACGLEVYDNNEFTCTAENKGHQVLVYAFRDSSHTNQDNAVPNVEKFCEQLKQNPKWTSYSENQ